MRRFQMSAGLVLLGALVLTGVGLQVLLHSPRFVELMERGELKRFKDGRGLFMNRGAFIEFEDRLLLDEIPNADFSRGGVFFFGTSTMKWGMKTWELEPDSRALVHNYGIGATNHRFVSQFVRHMVEQEGMLRAGGENVHVILTCFWTMSNQWGGNKGFFARLWGRYGLFSYDQDKGIQVSDLGTVRRKMKFERARLASSIMVNTRRMVREIAIGAGMQTKGDWKGRNMSSEDRRQLLEFAKAPNWEQDLAREMAALRDLIQYLRDKRVAVTVVLLPTTSIYDDSPLPQQYQSMLRTVAEDNKVPYVDLSKLLGENEYADFHHANYRGLGKVHSALMSLARRHVDHILATRR